MRIFSVKKNSLNKYKVDYLMQSLIVAKILKFKFVWKNDGSHNIVWSLNREIVSVKTADGPPCRIERTCYEDDEYWEGINLKSTISSKQQK